MRFQLNIILACLGVLVMTLALNSLLSLASFEKLYTRTLVSSYEVTVSGLRQSIERSLRLGKPLISFEGVTDILQQTIAETPDIQGAAVFDAQGKLLFNSGSYLPQPCTTLLNKHSAEGGAPLQRLIATELLSPGNTGEQYLTCATLQGKHKRLAGSVGIVFPRALVTDRLYRMAKDNLLSLAALGLGTAMVLASLLSPLVTTPFRRRMTDFIRVLEEAAKPSAQSPLDNAEPLQSPPAVSLPAPGISSPELEQLSQAISCVCSKSSAQLLPDDITQSLQQVTDSVQNLRSAKSEELTADADALVKDIASELHRAQQSCPLRNGATGNNATTSKECTATGPQKGLAEQSSPDTNVSRNKKEEQ